MNFQPQATPTNREQDFGPPGGLVQRARALAALLYDAASEADASGRIAPETWGRLHGSGLAMAPFPVRHGGEDLAGPPRCDDLVAVLRLIGAGDLSMARLFEGHVNAIALVCRFGTGAQIDALARDVAEGAFCAVWGADDAIGLRDEPIGPERRLTGRKVLASGAGLVTRPVVTAMSEAGQVMLLPRLRPGERADLSAWNAQGMRSTATGTVDFSGVVLSVDQILGRPGDFMGQPYFSGGAWRFCAAHLGATERLVDLARADLLSRGRDGDPYQLQRIAHCTAAVTTARFWIEKAARLLAEPTEEPQSIVAFVNLTRTVTERAALDVLEAVHRGIGLNAFIGPNPIERISRDLATYLRQPVPDLAMADAARTILLSSRPTGDLWSSDFAR
jgi:alkylation response protein AidB-like acyl-CoA dehydrogenase